MSYDNPIDLELEELQEQEANQSRISIGLADESISKLAVEGPYRITKIVTENYSTYSISVPNDDKLIIDRTDTSITRLINEKGVKRKWNFEQNSSENTENIKPGLEFPRWESRYGRASTGYVSHVSMPTPAPVPTNIIKSSNAEESTTSPKGTKRARTESNGPANHKKMWIKQFLQVQEQPTAAVPIEPLPELLDPIVPIPTQHCNSMNNPTESPKAQPNQSSSVSSRRSTVEVPNELDSYSESHEQVGSPDSEQNQSESEPYEPMSDDPDETIIDSENEEEDRTLLTLKPLSDTDTLYLALAVALGENPVEPVPEIPKPDPFCWQCHESCILEERQGCEFCQISFCQNCLTGTNNKAPKSRSKFPSQMPHMEPECEKLISLEWLQLLAQKRVCYNCVDRVAHALFNRTLGFMTSDYEREVNNLVFNDAVGLLMETSKQEDKLEKQNKNEKVVYNILTKVSQNHRKVVAPMTLKMIDEKAINHEYRSTADFVFDINLILHNLAIEKGVSSVPQNKIEAIRKWMKKEFHFVDTCATCYRNFYVIPERLTEDCGFEVPCGNPHSIVWAKWRGKYWLPAKVFECRLPGSLMMETDEVYVQFFSHDHSKKWRKPQMMKIEDLYLYSKKLPPQVGHKTMNNLKYKHKLDYAQKLVQKFLRLLDLFYDNTYVVPRNPVPLTDDMLYIPDIGEYHEKRVQEAGYFTQNDAN